MQWFVTNNIEGFLELYDPDFLSGTADDYICLIFVGLNKVKVGGFTQG